MGKDFLDRLASGVSFFAPLAKGRSANDRANENAAIDRADAVVVMDEGRERANIIRERGRRRAASRKVRTAASGFTGVGALQLELDEIEAAEFNALDELRVSSGQARRLTQSASQSVSRGKTAKRVGILQTLGVAAQQLGRKRKREETLKQFEA